MIRGMCENFRTPGVHRGGAQGAGLGGGSEGADMSFEFCSFLVPIPVIFHPILMLLVCENLGRTRTHIGHMCKCANVRNFAHPHLAS